MTQFQKVGIVDYGMGNLWSLSAALSHVGAEVTVVDDPGRLADFSHLVLPGVGSFRRASERLFGSGLGPALLRQVESGRSIVLGICLGMQLMGTSSSEHGFSEGLGLVPIQVERFREVEVHNQRIPHVGFAPVQFMPYPSGIFNGVLEGTHFYFVHSYRMLPEGDFSTIALCDYGVSFLAGFDDGNICGTQFHPEKSQQQGLRLLNNFMQRVL